MKKVFLGIIGKKIKKNLKNNKKVIFNFSKYRLSDNFNYF